MEGDESMQDPAMPAFLGQLFTELGGDDPACLSQLFDELGVDQSDKSVQQLLHFSAPFTVPNMALLQPKSLTDEQLRHIAEHLNRASASSETCSEARPPRCQPTTSFSRSSGGGVS